MWRHCGRTERFGDSVRGSRSWVGPAAEEEEEEEEEEESEHLDLKGRNNAGLRGTPEAFTRQCELKLLRVFSWGEEEVGTQIFGMDQSVAIQETLEREENCIIVSFFCLRQGLLWYNSKLKDELLQTKSKCVEE